MKTTRICGTGSALPAQLISNDDLAKIMDTSDEWIRSRTGIVTRGIVKEETTTSMAIEAAKKALQNAKVNAEDLDFIIVATLSPDMCLPSTACEVQAVIQAKKAVAFDLNAACAGFLFALHTAHAYLSANLYQTGLIIGVETLSKMMDWNDRSTCVLFGDGAGAAVVTQAESGIQGFMQCSEGERGMALACPNRRVNNPYVQNSKKLEYVSMDGQAVYKFAVTTVPTSISQVLEETKIDIADVKYFVLHQANARIIDSVAKRLKVDKSKFPTNLEKCGNMSAASIPVLLDEMNQAGMLKKGDIIVLAGFGAGLSYGATVMKW